ncbi:MAG: CDP-glycerol glycerophosphotransferase family protein, partial [Lachnospiraceae bacterium]|nr:CDP-glycerol glycerophosphotransferase family protein [Lachnospiraceae bacterium]
MFDYSVLERPMFFFCYDLENYRDNLRGFYLDFEKMAPGPISLNEEELIRDIRTCFSGENSECMDKVRAFKKEYNKYDDGHAGKRALDAIAERLSL